MICITTLKSDVWPRKLIVPPTPYPTQVRFVGLLVLSGQRLNLSEWDSWRKSIVWETQAHTRARSQQYWAFSPLVTPTLLTRAPSEWVKSLSLVRLFAIPWTVAHQAPPSMGFSRQEYWGGLPFPSPGDLPNPGIEPRSPAFQADTLTSEPPGKQETSL